MNSRFVPRTTRLVRVRRVPTATSEWPDSSGATSGASPARSVERSTSRYASTWASDAPQAAWSACPRPLRSRWIATVSGSVAARPRATSKVPSVLALSTIVMRQVAGNRRVR